MLISPIPDIYVVLSSQMDGYIFLCLSYLKIHEKIYSCSKTVFAYQLYKDFIIMRTMRKMSHCGFMIIVSAEVFMFTCWNTCKLRHWYSCTHRCASLFCYFPAWSLPSIIYIIKPVLKGQMLQCTKHVSGHFGPITHVWYRVTLGWLC